MLYCKTVLRLFRWDTGKVGERFVGMFRLRVGQGEWSTIDVITD